MTKATATRTRRRVSSPPSLASFQSLLVFSAILPLVVWLFSSSPTNGNTHASNLAHTLVEEAQQVEDWVGHHGGDQFKELLERLRREEGHKGVEQLTKAVRGAKKSIVGASRPSKERVQAVESSVDLSKQLDDKTEDETPLALFSFLFSSILSLLSFLFSLIRYIFLPITLPVSYIFHTTVVLPTRLVLAFLSALSPLFVLFGGCALIGAIVGGAAAGIMKLGSWVVVPEQAGGGRRVDKVGKRRIDR